MPQLEGGFSLTSNSSSNGIAVQTETALTMFENVAVLETDMYARALGVYGDVVIGRDLKGRFASISAPKHILSNRKNGCTWNPKGTMRINVDEFNTCPVEYDGEQCPDTFYGTCFERLFGTGNDARDFAATAEGQALLAQMMTKLYQGLGNSFFDLSNYANHPLISTANTNAFYNVGVEEWEAYVDQMLSGDCGGIITLLDALAAEGTAGYDMVIPIADVNPTTGKYIGNVINFMEGLKDQASSELSAAINTGVMINGQNRMPVIMLTPQIFNAYKAWIRAQAGTNELAYRYMIDRADGATTLGANVLTYDGLPVIQWDAPARFDAITGAQTYSGIIVAPQAFGILHDVADLRQFSGMGLMIEQSKRLADKGKIFMSTGFRWGAGISDKDFVSYATLVLHP